MLLSIGTISRWRREVRHALSERRRRQIRWRSKRGSHLQQAHLDSRPHGGTHSNLAQRLARLVGPGQGARKTGSWHPVSSFVKGCVCFSPNPEPRSDLSQRARYSISGCSSSGVFVSPSRAGPLPPLGGLLRASYDIGGAFPCHYLEDQTIPTARLLQLPHIRRNSSAIPCKQAIFALPSAASWPVRVCLCRAQLAVGRPLPRG